jgi:hypothetical protein
MPKSTNVSLSFRFVDLIFFKNACLSVAMCPANPVLLILVCVIVVMFSEVYEVMARHCHSVSEEKSKTDSGYRKA